MSTLGGVWLWLERVIDETSFIIAVIVGGVIAPLISILFGDNTLAFTLVTASLIFILADWISGISASKKDDVYGSAYGIDGIFRTFFMLLMMSGANWLDKLFGSPGVIFGVFTSGILYHVIQSATANAIRTGWGTHVPKRLLDWLSNWVQSEIKHKDSRAEKRKNERDG